MAACIKVAFYSDLNLLLRFTLLLHLQDTISFFPLPYISFADLLVDYSLFPSHQAERGPATLYCPNLSFWHNLFPQCTVQIAQQDAILRYSPVPSIYGLLSSVTLLPCDWFPSNPATLNSDMLRIYIIAFLCSCLL